MRSLRCITWLALAAVTPLCIYETRGEEVEKKPASAEKLFKQRDKDEDGFLSLEEFKSAMKKRACWSKLRNGLKTATKTVTENFL